MAFYFVATAVFTGLGWAWHHAAFTPAAPAGQAYVVAFTQDKTAAVTLTAIVNPNDPWFDGISIQVKGPRRRPERWLLIVQCPRPPASSSNQGMLSSEANQPIPPSTRINVYSGAGKAGLRLGCFPASKTNASIARVTLPSLETDQAIQQTQTAPTVYAELNTPGDLTEVLQVFPGCPAPTASPVTAPATTSPSGTGSATTSPGPASSTSPSPTAQAASVSASCYGQTQLSAAFSTYYLPTSVQTKEIMKFVNLSGYQTQSVFPVPVITNGKGGATGQTADEIYTWNGLSSLSPSLQVANLAGEQAANNYTFYAGVSFGIAGASGVAFVEKAWTTYLALLMALVQRLRRKLTLARQADEEAGGGPEGDGEETDRIPDANGQQGAEDPVAT